MSDSRIVSLINFINNLPTPKSHTVLHLSEHYSYDNVSSSFKIPTFVKICAIGTYLINTNHSLLFQIKLKDRTRILEKIQHVIASSELRTQLLKLRSTKEEAKKSFLTVEKY